MYIYIYIIIYIIIYIYIYIYIIYISPERELGESRREPHSFLPTCAARLALSS